MASGHCRPWILQVANNRVTMIVDTAERPEDIDEVRAREALERAQEQLRQQLSLREFKMSQASMARALTRLKGSHLKELSVKEKDDLEQLDYSNR